MKHALLAAVALLLVAGASLADRADKLINKVDPPKRFSEHKPEWSVKEKTYTFQQLDGPVKVPHWLIMDGDRVVAFIPRKLFHSGCVYVLDFRPGQAPKVDDIPMPSERWHIDTTIGAQLRTDAFIPSGFGSTDKSYDFSIADDKLTITRKFEGQTAFNKWTHRTKGKKVQVDTTNKVTFSVHLQLGYVVDTKYDTWTDQKLKRVEYASAAMSGRHTTWPEDKTCNRMAISTKDGGVFGYATNMGCTRKHNGTNWCPDGGFVAFLDDKSGWSTTYTNETGAPARLVVCPPHTDHDFQLPADKARTESRDGKDHYVIRHRMFAFPPEVTNYVWKNMDLKHKGERELLVRIGRVEDFEDQPLDVTGEDRGHPINASVTTDQARSGKRSMLVTKTAGLGSPTLCVRPGKTYRVEAWVRVAGEGTGQLSVQYQQWPGGKKPEAAMTSEKVTAKDGWQHVTIDFKAPKWGPALDLRFVVDNAKMYVDDFRLGEKK
ncbi:MAG: carbohydrate binding domain-containing protein [Phycisphaerae bacterium]